MKNIIKLVLNKRKTCSKLGAFYEEWTDISHFETYWAKDELRSVVFANETIRCPPNKKCEPDIICIRVVGLLRLCVYRLQFLCICLFVGLFSFLGNRVCLQRCNMSWMVTIYHYSTVGSLAFLHLIMIFV